MSPDKRRSFDPRLRSCVLENYVRWQRSLFCTLKGVMVKDIDPRCRQGELVTLAAEGLTDKEICLQTGLKISSVKTYWSRLSERLNACSRSHIIAKVLIERHAAGLADLKKFRHAAQKYFDESAAPLALACHERKLLLANEACVALLGLSPQDDFGRPLASLKSDYGPQLSELCGELPSRRQLILNDSEGNVIYLDTAVTPISETSNRVFLIGLADLSHYAPGLCADLPQSMGQPLLSWTASVDGHVDSWNDAFARYSGLTSAEIAGVGCRALMPAEDVEASSRRFAMAVADQTSYEAIVRLRCLNGSLRRHLLRLEPLKDECGRVVRWLGTARRVTSS